MKMALLLAALFVLAVLVVFLYDIVETLRKKP